LGPLFRPNFLPGVSAPGPLGTAPPAPILNQPVPELRSTAGTGRSGASVSRPKIVGVPTVVPILKPDPPASWGPRIPGRQVRLLPVHSGPRESSCLPGRPCSRHGTSAAYESALPSHLGPPSPAAPCLQGVAAGNFSALCFFPLGHPGRPFRRHWESAGYWRGRPVSAAYTLFRIPLGCGWVGPLILRHHSSGPERHSPRRETRGQQPPFQTFSAYAMSNAGAAQTPLHARRVSAKPIGSDLPAGTAALDAHIVDGLTKSLWN